MKEFACPDLGITVTRGVIDSFVAAFGAYKARGEKVVTRHHSQEAHGRIGGYHGSASGDRAGTMLLDNPYPCAFDLGIIETIAKRFEPGATVAHVGGSCRHDGDDVCTYRVEW